MISPFVKIRLLNIKRRFFLRGGGTGAVSPLVKGAAERFAQVDPGVAGTACGRVSLLLQHNIYIIAMHIIIYIISIIIMRRMHCDNIYMQRARHTKSDQGESQ